jgi:glyoxylase-like metal-dependent hydrolase (beta-lactamase superfamily II)
MYFKQFYLVCLAQASYLIGSDGEAAVVDPRRDVDEYLAEAAAQGLKIRYVIETHLHADFVSGHRELAERTGAEIVIGARAGAEFPHRAVSEGEEIQLGNVTLRFIETPGHTPESMSVLITDQANPAEPAKLLTGDTLFIGDVGRPDLAGGKGFTAAEMAGMLYDSLHQKILTLPDETEVHPAHGAGSMCGRNISSETSSTIGQQRRLNYALQPMSCDEFVAMMTAELPRMPAYFPVDAERNRAGAPAIADLTPPAALSPDEFSGLQAKGYLILDTRPAAEFGAGHIPDSLNIGLGGKFAGWSGDFIPIGSPILLVTSSAEQVHEAVVRLARVGHETVRGYLADGIESWAAAGLPLLSIPQIGFPELDRLRADSADLQILDVRRPDEYRAGHVPAAINIPLDNALSGKAVAALNRSRPTAIICASGYRSSTASAMLEYAGFEQLMNVTGGTNAWIEAGYPVDRAGSV